jgi:SAM-dependent methyltransferase
MSLRLNLGCGNDVREDYTNVDNFSSNPKSPNVINADLRIFPWPFQDNSADEILMNHVLEHMPDTYAVVSEIKRILRPGGFFHGQVPHMSNRIAFTHPQHFRVFVPYTFEKLALDFDLKCDARSVRVPGGYKVCQWKWTIRNIFFPGKVMEFLGLPQAYDFVDFRLWKK